jgi:hypothetical protein
VLLCVRGMLGRGRGRVPLGLVGVGGIRGVRGVLVVLGVWVRHDWLAAGGSEEVEDVGVSGVGLWAALGGVDASGEEG